MGRASAIDLISMCKEDFALRWHLGSNHYPPILIVLPTAKRCLKKVRNGQINTKVRLPEGVTWKGKKLAPVKACMNEWHLWDFIDPEDYNEFQ